MSPSSPDHTQLVVEVRFVKATLFIVCREADVGASAWLLRNVSSRTDLWYRQSQLASSTSPPLSYLTLKMNEETFVCWDFPNTESKCLDICLQGPEPHGKYERVSLDEQRMWDIAQWDIIQLQGWLPTLHESPLQPVMNKPISIGGGSDGFLIGRRVFMHFRKDGPHKVLIFSDSEVLDARGENSIGIIRRSTRYKKQDKDKKQTVQQQQQQRSAGEEAGKGNNAMKKSVIKIDLAGIAISLTAPVVLLSKQTVRSEVLLLSLDAIQIVYTTAPLLWKQQGNVNVTPVNSSNTNSSIPMPESRTPLGGSTRKQLGEGASSSQWEGETEHVKSVEFKLGNLQLDDQRDGAVFPVVLQRTRRRGIQSAINKREAMMNSFDDRYNKTRQLGVGAGSLEDCPLIQLKISYHPSSRSLSTHWKHLEILCQELTMNIDMAFCIQLFLLNRNYLTTIFDQDEGGAGAGTGTGGGAESPQNPNPYSSSVALRRHTKLKSAEQLEVASVTTSRHRQPPGSSNTHKNQKRVQGVPAFPAYLPGSSGLADESVSRLFFDFFLLHPMKFNVTFISNPGLASALMEDKNSSHMFLFRFIAQGMNIDGASLKLRSIGWLDHGMSWPQLKSALQEHYKRQVLLEASAIMGHGDVFGNPFGLFKNISIGFMDAFYEPGQGLLSGEATNVVKGAKLGAESLFNNTMSALFNSVAKISGTAAQGTRAFTREGPQPEVAAALRPRNAMEGVEIGAKKLAEDVQSGFSGVFELPAEGARVEGGLGFAKGMGFGLLGLIVKPITGVFDFLKHTSEGVSAGTNIDPTVMTERRRMSRMLYGTDRILRPYREEDARCKQILASTQGGKWENVRTLDIVLGHLSESRTYVALICTDEHLVCIDIDNGAISFVVERSTVERCDYSEKGQFFFDAMGRNKELLTFSMDLDYGKIGKERRLHHSDADAMVSRIQTKLKMRRRGAMMSQKHSSDSHTDGWASSNPDEDMAGNPVNHALMSRSSLRQRSRGHLDALAAAAAGGASGASSGDAASSLLESSLPCPPGRGASFEVRLTYTEDQMRRANQRKQEELSTRIGKKEEELGKEHEQQQQERGPQQDQD